MLRPWDGGAVQTHRAQCSTSWCAAELMALVVRPQNNNRGGYNAGDATSEPAKDEDDQYRMVSVSASGLQGSPVEPVYQGRTRTFDGVIKKA